MSTNKAQTPADGSAATGKKSPVIMIAIVAVILLAIIGTFLVTKSVSAKSKGVAAKKHVEHGPVMTLDEFLVNLADNSGDHFLKVTVGVEINKEKGVSEEAMKEKVALIRDAIVTSLSSQTREDVATPKGRDLLKLEMKKRINEQLGDDLIKGVYFTNFVTQ
ncbi:MAG: fliL [Capsulimonas sp.]|jgi:flagellar FliL protein|nr:fliL [Capsulimonas sp.]